MKKVLALLGLLLAINLFAQSQTENYVFSTVCLDADCIKRTETIQYSDGLGRPKQILNVKASPSEKDVVTHIEYDALGRQPRDYMPVPQTGGSTRNIYPAASATNASVYGNDKIYAEKVIENSPLGRVQQQFQPGLGWENNPASLDYRTNVANEVLNFSSVTDPSGSYVSSLVISGYYTANKLYKIQTTDEDGNTTSEYKNVQGQILLIRKTVQETVTVQGFASGPVANTQNVDTYYVYNQYNELSFVISPMASKELKKNPNQTITIPDANPVITELCYQYRYDDKSRLIEKKLPGKGWEYFVYDKQDRLIMSQDANLRADQKWLFTKYDQFGRVAFTGLTLPANTSRATEQTNANAIVDYTDTATNISYGNNNVRRTDYHYISYSNIWLNYTIENTYPHHTNISALLSLNYYDKYITEYDDYNPGGIGIPARPDTILDQKTLSDSPDATGKSTKGLPVASYVNIIDGNQWTKTYLWYDQLGRDIGTYTINHLGGYTRVFSQLDFAGIVKKTETWHKKLDAEGPVRIIENFDYDHQNRLLKHYHEVVSRTPKVLLAENHYNEKDQLDWKKTGVVSDTNFGALSAPLQQIFYDYNIRNWMTGINLNQNDVTRPLDPSRIFSYKIKYNTPDTGIERYNGNISEVDWSYEGNGTSRYEYSYDKLNRLTVANYKAINFAGSQDQPYYNEQQTYDLNGNILTLNRNARSQTKGDAAIQIDKLKYYYENNNLSNKVWKITDNEGNAANPAGYPGGGGTITYDGNGNMKTMPDKGITQPIVYNYLNLPKTVLQNSNPINYTYRADGVKVHKQFTVGGQNIDTDYLDGFVYTTPYTDELEGILLQKPEVASAGQVQAFELTAKAVANPGGPGGPQVQPISSPDFFPTAEGFYDYKNSKYIYQYKDHLGNVRLSYSRTSEGDLSVESTNDYYPFGLNFVNIHPVVGPPVYNPSVSYENWKYNGKELEETGMYDYGARFYMPDIGRFGMYDPLAEKTFEPYAYVYNNPVRMIDPTGMEGEEVSSGGGGSGGEAGAGDSGKDTQSRGNDPGKGGCCPGEIAPNKPGGVNNPHKIEQVNLTAPGRAIKNASAGVSFTSQVAAIAIVVRSIVMPRISGAAIMTLASRTLWALPLILNGDTAKDIPADIPITTTNNPRGNLYLYRNMRSVNGKPMIGEGLDKLGLRDRDVNNLSNSTMITPLFSNGLSVTIAYGSKIPSDVPDTHKKQTLFRIPASSLISSGLVGLPVPNPSIPNYGQIRPAMPMSVGTFRTLIQSTAPAWQPVK